ERKRRKKESETITKIANILPYEIEIHEKPSKLSKVNILEKALKYILSSDQEMQKIQNENEILREENNLLKELCISR
ncbi:17737_t:CDS:1, partial [Racocetra fulgida]